MRDAQTQGEHAERAFEAAWEGEPAERDAQLAAMDADHLHGLVETCESLRLAARALWLERVTKPRGER